MADLTILHLSDFHWSEAKATDQRIVVQALLEDIDRLKSEGIIPDLVIFTGDLVQAGTKAEFDAVRVELLSPVRERTGNVPLFLTPGNHDIQRGIVRESGGFIEAGLKAKLNSVDALNRFIDDAALGGVATNTAIDRLSNFEAAYTTFGCAPILRNTPLLKTHVAAVNGRSVGVASFNTAWRATGEPENADRHMLLLGERHVDLALDDLQDCDWKIALFHHPLDWLADFDSVAVASRMYADFDVLAFGHSHRAEPEARITTAGTAILSQAGCLYEHRDYFNGFQVLRVREADGQVDFHIRSYFNRPRRAFDKALNVAPNGLLTLPYSGRTRVANAEVDAFLRTARPIIRQAAADQVNIVDAVSDLRLDAKEAFICPPLTVHRTSTTSGDSATDEDQVSAEEMLRTSDNYLIVGPRESSKSTLAHYLAVIAAEGAIDRPRIPSVLDFRNLKITAYGLARAIATYFGTAKQGLDIESRLATGDFLLLIDNFSGRDLKSREELKKLVEKYPQCRWILMGDAQAGSPSVQEDEEDVLAGFRSVHIQTLPRKSIRELSRRWCEPLGLDNQKAFAAVMAQLRESNLPRTGYMVTLLLWGLYQERQFEQINEAVLLTYVIDHLLGKADFTQVIQGRFDPTAKEITLQHLAYVLREAGGVLPKNDVVVSLIAFFNQKGLDYDGAEVLAKLVSCGLLINNAGLVAFKYRCFEEYFYANLLRNDANRLAHTLSERRFVHYSRELELLSGLRRQNKDLLDIISFEITAGMPPELREFEPERFDEIALKETGAGISTHRLEDIRKKKLSADQIDDLMDAADRQAGDRQRRVRGADGEKEGDTSPAVEPTEICESADGKMPVVAMRPVAFMAAVDLLGKVVRNSEFTDATDKRSAARLHLKSSIQVMLLYADIIKDLLHEASQQNGPNGKAIFSPEDTVALRYVLLKWFVLATSNNISTQVGTEKLFSIFNEIIEDPKTSTAEALMVAMMLMDLGHPKWPAMWSALIEKNKDRRFVLDLLMERLWELLHTRPLSEAERKRVETAAEGIEAAFGLPKHARHEIVRTIRDTAKATARNADQP